MKKFILLLLSLLVLCTFSTNALVLTNGPEANVTAPSNMNIGWWYFKENIPGTLIGPSIVCSVKHVAIASGGYTLIKVIEPPDYDIRFLIFKEVISSNYYAKLFMKYTNVDTINLAYMVGIGVGGEQLTPTTWKWAPESTRKKRWGYTTKLILNYSPTINYFFWKTDQAASSSGDSGGGVFTENGEFIGPIKFGDNPVVLGDFQSGGVIAGPFYNLIKEYLPYLNSTNSTPSENINTNITPVIKRFNNPLVTVTTVTTPVSTPPPIRVAIPYTNPDVTSTNKPK